MTWDKCKVSSASEIWYWLKEGRKNRRDFLEHVSFFLLWLWEGIFEKFKISFEFWVGIVESDNAVEHYTSRGWQYGEINGKQQ